VDRKTTINNHQSSRRRHLFGFSAVAALALMLIAITLNALNAGRLRERAEHWQVHTMEVLLVAERARAAASEALRGQRGYLITGDPRFLDPYRKASDDGSKLVARLQALTRDNAAQRQPTADLRIAFARYLSTLQRSVAVAREGDSTQAGAIVKNGIGRPEIEAVLALIDRVEIEESRLLAQRELANARAERRSEVADLALAGLALLFLAVVAWAGVEASRARTQALVLEEKLRRMATTDELTGLLNRRAFLQALDAEIRRSARSNTPLALALIDLDHFKHVNDRFGHAGGDEVLRKFAETARETMRNSDVIGRLGGEEFAVLMPDTDQEQSRFAGERLREAMAQRRILLSTGAMATATISAGIAYLIRDEDRDRLIVRADEALYDAKDSGRNRIRMAA
jgi:diguanylate cyclase (GGDEF)-like protein